ncbi:Kinase suppressor of Ras 1 [Camelus dromedarius]|uniref:Kinase suppressor of Ras 1 n=1 Tax=Camelus dromedarius TaxID=9838 RepID=A0A5N4D4U0_CAMDR|nr:Kinase suppressor of Ras 1 [Camelus dromedarius]
MRWPVLSSPPVPSILIPAAPPPPPPPRLHPGAHRHTCWTALLPHPVKWLRGTPSRWRSRYYGKGRYGHLDFKNSCPVLEEYINSSKIVPRFERFGLGVLESSNPKM